MVTSYKHISFDLDGTLVHTISQYRHTIIPVIVSRLGGRIPHPRSIDRFWFESHRDEVITRDFNLDPSAFWKVYNEIDTADGRASHTYAYDDAAPALQRLALMGKKISVITGARALVAQKELAKLGSVNIHYLCSTTGHGFREKPHPESLYHVLETLKVVPNETLYVGNSNEDAFFAKNAGVDFVYLERKQHEFDNTEWIGKTIHSLAEIFVSDR